MEEAVNRERFVLSGLLLAAALAVLFGFLKTTSLFNNSKLFYIQNIYFGQV
jgi:hypothetical protein